MVPIVDCLVARSGLYEPSGSAYDYLLAGDGLYLASRNDYLDVRVPVARLFVRGLPPLGSRVALTYGLIPLALWREALAICRALARAEREVLLTIGLTPQGTYVLRVPPQRVGRTSLVYRPADGAILEIHSHHRLPARFSEMDDRDEVGLRLYGVVGRLGAEEVPEVALRVGAYGYFLPVPFGRVFGGEPYGLRDLGAEVECGSDSEPDGGDCCSWSVDEVGCGVDEQGLLEGGDGLPG